MRKIRGSTCLRSFLLPLATVLWLGVGACTSWKPVKEPVAATLEANRPAEVRIDLVDGTQIEVGSPRIVSDSLEGLVREGKHGDDVERVRYPLAQIASISTHHTDGWKTAGLVAGIALGIILVAGIAAAASGASDWEWDWGPM